MIDRQSLSRNRWGAPQGYVLGVNAGRTFCDPRTSCGDTTVIHAPLFCTFLGVNSVILVKRSGKRSFGRTIPFRKTPNTLRFIRCVNGLTNHGFVMKLIVAATCLLLICVSRSASAQMQDFSCSDTELQNFSVGEGLMKLTKDKQRSTREHGIALLRL